MTNCNALLRSVNHDGYRDARVGLKENIFSRPTMTLNVSSSLMVGITNGFINGENLQTH